MFEEMRDIFFEVIDLAREKRGILDSSNDLNIEGMEESPYSTARKRLRDYLESLSYDQVKIIKTVMYIGRDTSYATADTNPKDLYEEVFNSLIWHENKSNEVSRIVQKESLGEYLLKGMEVLKI